MRMMVTTMMRTVMSPVIATGTSMMVPSVTERLASS